LGKAWFWVHCFAMDAKWNKKVYLTHGKKCDIVLICIEMIIVKGKQFLVG
jgi:hypothetical protein